jgi:imidazole glycerol-phosphate synthase subunit HisF
MHPPRIIPVLLLTESGVVKTTRFKEARYVGDPLNALRVFNDKEVDEVVILDIEAWKHGRGPDFDRVAELAGECFMPLGYGGGITTVEQIRVLFRSGVEKVLLNTVLHKNPDLISRAADAAGSQSVVVSMDVKRNWLGRPRVYVAGGTVDTGVDPVEWARLAAAKGAGEIVVNAIDRDGTGVGYDLELVRLVTQAVPVPVVAVGGAASLAHMAEAVRAGADAAAAGSLFVFHGKHKAVLITYPSPAQIKEAFTHQP